MTTQQGLSGTNQIPEDLKLQARRFNKMQKVTGSAVHMVMVTPHGRHSGVGMRTGFLTG